MPMGPTKIHIPGIDPNMASSSSLPLLMSMYQDIDLPSVTARSK